jgi:hypothetical protein
MTARDRMVLIGVVVLAVLAAGWLLVVSPERHKAAAAQAQVQSAHQQLEGAQAQAASARAAQQRYTAAYKSVVALGKAVPSSEEVPSLIYELEQASNQREVEFNSITAGATSGSSSSASTLGAASGAAAEASFSQMPFTFVFKGSFEGLAHLLGEIDDFATRTTTGDIQVSGRLLTIQSADITIENQASSGSGSSSSSGRVPLSATITATAYVLPASEALTGGASAIGPSAASTSSSSSSSPATPAVVRVTP